MSTDTGKSGNGRNRRGAEPEPMTEEERLEAELAEQARVNSGDWEIVESQLGVEATA